MCSLEFGTIFRNLSKYHEKINKYWAFDARQNFGNDKRLYKRNDYRCLKPSKDIHPENWTYYDMDDFRAAKTQKDLKNMKGSYHKDISIFLMGIESLTCGPQAGFLFYFLSLFKESII